MKERKSSQARLAATASHRFDPGELAPPLLLLHLGVLSCDPFRIHLGVKPVRCSSQPSSRRRPNPRPALPLPLPSRSAPRPFQPQGAVLTLSVSVPFAPAAPNHLLVMMSPNWSEALSLAWSTFLLD